MWSIFRRIHVRILFVFNKKGIFLCIFLNWCLQGPQSGYFYWKWTESKLEENKFFLKMLSKFLKQRDGNWHFWNFFAKIETDQKFWDIFKVLNIKIRNPKLNSWQNLEKPFLVDFRLLLKNWRIRAWWKWLGSIISKNYLWFRNILIFQCFSELNSLVLQVLGIFVFSTFKTPQSFWNR